MREHRKPAEGWARAWVLALAIVVVALGGFEAWVRSEGFRAQADDVAAWTTWRSRVNDTSTVILGTSRVQGGLDPEVWSETTGEDPPVMLAMLGESPYPILADLASEESFRGTVLVGFVGRYVFDPSGTLEEEARSFLRSYHETLWSPSRRIEHRLRFEAMRRLAFRHPRLTRASLFLDLLEANLPEAPITRRRDDRFYRQDFRKYDPPEMEVEEYLEKLPSPPSAEQRDRIVERWRRAVTEIERRGGRVILLRMPSCGVILTVEKRLYPRHEYWDRIVEGLDVEAVHFEDHPELRGFECPDGEHLDYRDARRFTAALARIVESPRERAAP